LAFVLPLEVIGVLAIYQQIARFIANTTIGAVYQFVSPFVLKKGDAQGPKLGDTVVQSFVAISGFIILAIPVGFLLPYISDYLLRDVFVLDFLTFIFVCLTIALNQASRINELTFFKRNEVHRLILPLFLSVITFFVIAMPLAQAFGLMGAIAGLFVATGLRFITVVLRERSI